MNRRIQIIRGILVVTAIICLLYTIGSTYARFSAVGTRNYTFADSINKIKTVIVSAAKK